MTTSPDVIGNDRRAVLLHAVIAALKSRGGRAKPGQLLEDVAAKLTLTPYELAHVKSGIPRWEVHVRWYSTACVRAGYIVKEQGHWLLTDVGEKSLQLTPKEFYAKADAAYREWRAGRPDVAEDEPDTEVSARPSRFSSQAVYEQSAERAQAEIEEHINALDPYDFQKLVAALLSAMGYSIPFVAPKGRDGGVDVIAYKDPLGVVAPRIMVQVKHRENKLTVREVRELEGVLRRDGDIGLLVSSGGFTNEVQREVRASHRHIETMDLTSLIRLWKQHYDKIGEQGRQLLPLVQVYFLAPATDAD